MRRGLVGSRSAAFFARTKILRGYAAVLLCSCLRNAEVLSLSPIHNYSWPLRGMFTFFH